MSIDGDTVVIGAFGDDDDGSWSGSAYVFTLPPAVSSPPPPLAIDGNATHLGYDHDLVFTEALDPTWTFEYVQPAVLEHAMPPAAIPGAGGIFGSSNGLLATFAAPIPSPAIGALASRSGAVVGLSLIHI